MKQAINWNAVLVTGGNEYGHWSVNKNDGTADYIFDKQISLTTGSFSFTLNVPFQSASNQCGVNFSESFQQNNKIYELNKFYYGYIPVPNDVSPNRTQAPSLLSGLDYANVSPYMGSSADNPIGGNGSLTIFDPSKGDEPSWCNVIYPTNGLPSSSFNTLTGRTWTVEVKGSGASFDMNGLRFGLPQSDSPYALSWAGSASGKWITLDELNQLLPGIKVNLNQINNNDAKLSIIFPNGPAIQYMQFTGNFIAPNVAETYSVNFGYHDDQKTDSNNSIDESFSYENNNHHGFFPTINATDKKINVSEFDINDLSNFLMDGVSVNDVQDGYDKDKIEISNDSSLKNALVNHQTGTYTVTYKTTNSKNLTSYKTINVVVYKDEVVTDQITNTYTVHYEYDNGNLIPGLADRVVTAHFTRTGGRDPLTGQVKWNSWTTNDNIDVDIKSPQLTGYTPDHKTVIGKIIAGKNQEFKVKYFADNESLQINYVDEQGKQLATSDNLTGKYGDHYQTVPKDIIGYHLIKTEGEPNGSYTDGKQSVTYVYAKDDEQVTVHYVDESGKSLANNKIITGKYGDTYQTNAKSITGYHLIRTEGNASGKYTIDTPDVTYVYAPDEVTMTINYVDEHNDNQILKTETITGVYGSNYSLTPEYQIEDHKYTYGGESPVTGIFTKNGIINLPYYQTPTGVVNVQYEQVDNNGDPMGIFILPPATMSGYIGSNYDILIQQVKNYNYLRSSNNLTGTYGYNPQWITLFYQYVNPYTKGVVNVHYVDENGNPIRSNTSMSGKIGSNYEITPIDIPGYTFEKTEGNLTGQFTPVAQNVTLVYKNNAPVGNGVVNVNYVDENGNQIAEPITNSGSFGSKFKVSPINITGYTYVKTEGNPTGIYGQDAQTVTFVYQKNTPVTNGIVNINYVDENGNMIANSTSLTGILGTAYQITPKQLDGYTYVKSEGDLAGQYTDTAQNITLVYQSKTIPVTNGTVTVKYVDEQGNEIKTMQTLTGKIGNYYNINPVEITGYTYEKTNGNLTGQYTKNNQIITLIYKKDVVSTVTITYVDQNGDQLAPEKKVHGKVASKYNIASPIIAGYNTNQTMVSGEFMAENQNIQVVYNKLDKPVVPPTDNNGNSSQTPYEPTNPTNNDEHGSQTPFEPKTSTDSKGTSTSTKTHNQTSEVAPETTETDGNTHHVLSSVHDGQDNKTVTTSNNNLPETVTETASHKTNKATTLPQTGQSKDNRLLSIIGAFLLSVFGILGLNGFKKKKED
ncbi:hypothetical protein BGL34_04430 [Fructilactobacillus lindneri]|uniref:Cell surface protein n=1 Tax=Fructilactobacillus lindneri DSM 20690 = JCM 11027 TaxID=1122148 RepID=A0A0R2JX74_9LACO|nr:MucBP domain-containing protein [Fructilactobacillus lindneri]ANZ57606.1 hypothetical protein AYR60_01870 [Fructilactobacillus lindneri]KRN79564.1 cell surface protein precursor [Fructilactobacillus lindneri DSM 20690 = JCM 11027]POG97757.1 hypothetical protein BGL31_06015 [Fructilactobacillus lindneri]POH00017.1 hypothetical protein BGL32_04450 [Fructilactobacillus lindneri]POH02444.1 hypothetical protein BGL33_04220 [Fructilactobacillus lindneri]